MPITSIMPGPVRPNRSIRPERSTAFLTGARNFKLFLQESLWNAKKKTILKDATVHMTPAAGKASAVTVLLIT